MAEQGKCRRCGKGVPADAPAGLCPECLLKVGLQSRSQEPPGDGGESAIPTASYGPAPEAAVRTDKDGRLVLAPGEQFGPYRIVRRLGAGGMGTVYEADHLESGRRVALKVLGHRLDSPEAKQRFLREGRLAASVNHPNSVYVFGTEEIAGAPVIAMELVPGGTLEERVLRKGPLPVGETVDAILQVIDGLEAAEARGVLHRDVKAANCFVDREGTVKVGDFGLSISTSLRGDSNLTAEGTFLGTPAFSSPEQLRGDELDVRSDIYAVGVTLYYLLTGAMPFKAENLIRLIAAVLEHPPRSPAELRPDIPHGLVRAVLRCLQKQPAARFRTYDELRQALAPYSSAAPTPAALGLRLGAGIIDHALMSPVAALLMWVWAGDFTRMSSPGFYGSRDHNLMSAILAVCYMVYFAVPEGLWGASLGKAICGLRVLNPKRNVPGVPRALVRAVVYVLFPQMAALACVVLVGAGAIAEPPMWLLQVIAYSWFVFLALIFSTARRQNGYAGVHDLASNTRVLLKLVHGTRPLLPGDGEPPTGTEATPTVGPYHVLGSLDKRGGYELLLGYDTRLLRKVWIRRLPEGEPALGTEVRDLGRPGRLRWLAGRRAPGDCWDAYEAPSGGPLVRLLEKPQPWESVRYWLCDLVEELVAGLKHQSPPDVLALDRIWITAEGRAKLLDFPAPGVDPQSRWAALPHLAGREAASAGPFLNGAAIAALEGRAVEPDEALCRTVVAPLPLSARAVLGELPRIEDPEPFARRLKPLLGRTASISRARRLGLLAALVAPLLLFAGFMVFGTYLSQRWLDAHPEASPLSYCLGRMEEIDRAGGSTDAAQKEQRRDLEVYVAGRFAKTISDAGAWSNSLAKILFNENQRKLAERAAAAHPVVSAEEVAAAATRLKPFLDKMPARPPGFTVERKQMLLMVVNMALLNLFILVVIPSLVCALLFRGGLLMYVFGIAVVNKDGSRASRLRTLWRSLVTWSPCVLLPLLLVPLKVIGLDRTLSISVVLAVGVALVAWSASMRERGIPDRIAGTYPVPR